ncbi:major facilitator superfamily domain-containing protein 1 [Platysternon megacephalum]|uniref:Major facilitator superfamily domain-containing protein 1 n=1 Tax=Platysternon megacephalum TaxID=55544 RepID=A0A4D9EL91_9SAUR|nr:major facilitator superfamily domain-containing protein 1 [Platysternon megacephalum]
MSSLICIHRRFAVAHTQVSAHANANMQKHVCICDCNDQAFHGYQRVLVTVEGTNGKDKLYNVSNIARFSHIYSPERLFLPCHRHSLAIETHIREHVSYKIIFRLLL